MPGKHKNTTYLQRLKPESRAKYDAMLQHIKERESLKDFSVGTYAKEFDINYHTALDYYSHMLKSIHAENLKHELESNSVQELPTCPTCGKLKDEVSEVSICRDVFHYL